MNGRNTIHKCERMIRPKRMDMDQCFNSKDHTERIFEIDNTYFVLSIKSGKTLFYEKSGTMIIESSLSNLFLTDISTVSFCKGILLEER